METCAELALFGPVEFVPTDVADPEAVEKLRQKVVAGGGLDLLVNNAAVMVCKPIEELVPDEWQRVLAVNLTGPFLCSRTFVPLLRARHGSIVNIASTRAQMSDRITSYNVCYTKLLRIMQHIEEAGIHSGDSACSLPPISLKPELLDEVRRQTRALSYNFV